MKPTEQKVIKAIEKVEQRTSTSFSYHTDDNGNVTDIFCWNAPGLKIHGPFSTESQASIVSRLTSLLR